jgi:hypothetical protein
MIEDYEPLARPQIRSAPLVIMWANAIARTYGPLSPRGWSRLCQRLEACPTVTALHREVERISEEWGGCYA